MYTPNHDASMYYTSEAKQTQPTHTQIANCCFLFPYKNVNLVNDHFVTLAEEYKFLNLNNLNPIHYFLDQFHSLAHPKQ
jgi:hypothetical protein